PGFPQDSGTVKIPAAWLIDRRNWKGKMFDGVGVHGSQALVLVNPGHRGGEQVLAVAKNIQSDIQQAFDIALEIEPRVI
ncbi:MAG: UDP-N-acetylenolpyruvoylglucosamine reductase, partial [Pseudomonadales bacterium]